MRVTPLLGACPARTARSLSLLGIPLCLRFFPEPRFSFALLPPHVYTNVSRKPGFEHVSCGMTKQKLVPGSDHKE